MIYSNFLICRATVVNRHQDYIASVFINEVMGAPKPRAVNTTSTKIMGIPGAGICTGPFSQSSVDRGLILPTLVSTSLDRTHFTGTRYYRLAKTSGFPSPLAPIIGHPDFIPGIYDKAFQLQLDPIRGSAFIGPSGWVLPSVLSVPRNSSVLGRWKILQLSHFLQSLPDHICFHRQPTSFEYLCLGDEPLWKSLSSSYGTLPAGTSQHDSPYLSKWKKDIKASCTL